MTMKSTLCALGLAAVASAALAGKPHDHGVARLDVAVEARGVSLLLEVPLDSLVGFEHEPRSDAERQQVDLALTRLRAGAALFRIDPAAGCAMKSMNLQSAALSLGGEKIKDGHAEVECSYEFSCTNGGRAGFVEANLFEFFPRLQRVEVQTATRRGQMKASLVRPVTRVPLAR
jgi:hypothetical protein